MSVPRATASYRIAARVVIVLVRLVRWRLDIRGTEHIPRRGGAIVAFNHHSFADAFMCGWGVWRHVGRPIRFLGKAELFQMPVLGWLLRSAKQVPVERGSRVGRQRALAAAVQALRDGEIIAVAPEQTISESFDLLPFRTGATRMARDAGVPIVPSVGWGSQRFYTKGGKPHSPFGLHILVRYGAPITVGPDDDLVEATQRLHDAMAQMLDAAQREYPVKPRPGSDWWVPRRLGGSAPDHADVLRKHLEQEAAWRDAQAATDEQRQAG